MPGQDLASSLEMAMLERQARWLLSPALGSGRMMSKQLFHGAEQPWGVSGCEGWPESTVMVWDGIATG